jgi:hypothetical protein
MILSVACVLLCGAAALVVGCNSAKVSNENRTTAVAPARPTVIYVGTFDLGATKLQSDPGTITGRPRLLRLPQEDPVEKIQRLEELLANQLVNDLNSAGLPAKRLTADNPRPTQGWLVRGAFLEMTEGNRLQRAVIGFGAGSANQKLYIAVADLAHEEGQKLLDFNTDTTPNQTPGGFVAEAAAHSPWAMLGKYVLEGTASEQDIVKVAKATSDEIAAYAGVKKG